MKELSAAIPLFPREQTPETPRIYFMPDPEDPYKPKPDDLDELEDKLYDNYCLRIREEWWRDTPVLSVACTPDKVDNISQFLGEQGYWPIIKSLSRVKFCLDTVVLPVHEDY